MHIAVPSTKIVPAVECDGKLVRRYSVGYYGVPGGAGGPIHIHDAATGRPACGVRLGERMEFQWCSYETLSYVECKRCKAIGPRLITGSMWP